MDPFLGEVRIFPWEWAPKGWAKCDGASLPIQQNAALYTLLKETYGTDGPGTFRLPDLRGRTPVHIGEHPTEKVRYALGEAGGVEATVLDVAHMPEHTHSVNALAGSNGNSSNPRSALPAAVGFGTGMTSSVDVYAPAMSGPAVVLAQDTFSHEGGGAAHNNMQPFLVLNFCIATLGIYPPRN